MKAHPKICQVYNPLFSMPKKRSLTVADDDKNSLNVVDGSAANEGRKLIHQSINTPRFNLNQDALSHYDFAQPKNRLLCAATTDSQETFQCKSQPDLQDSSLQLNKIAVLPKFCTETDVPDKGEQLDSYEEEGNDNQKHNQEFQIFQHNTDEEPIDLLQQKQEYKAQQHKHTDLVSCQGKSNASQKQGNSEINNVLNRLLINKQEKKPRFFQTEQGSTKNQNNIKLEVQQQLNRNPEMGKAQMKKKQYKKDKLNCSLDMSNNLQNKKPDQEQSLGFHRQPGTLNNKRNKNDECQQGKNVNNYFSNCPQANLTAQDFDTFNQKLNNPFQAKEADDDSGRGGDVGNQVSQGLVMNENQRENPLQEDLRSVIEQQDLNDQILRSQLEKDSTSIIQQIEFIKQKQQQQQQQSAINFRKQVIKKIMQNKSVKIQCNEQDTANTKIYLKTETDANQEQHLPQPNDSAQKLPTDFSDNHLQDGNNGLYQTHNNEQSYFSAQNHYQKMPQRKFFSSNKQQPMQPPMLPLPLSGNYGFQRNNGEKLRQPASNYKQTCKNQKRLNMLSQSPKIDIDQQQISSNSPQSAQGYKQINQIYPHFDQVIAQANCPTTTAAAAEDIRKKLLFHHFRSTSSYWRQQQCSSQHSKQQRQRLNSQAGGKSNHSAYQQQQQQMIMEDSLVNDCFVQLQEEGQMENGQTHNLGRHKLFTSSRERGRRETGSRSQSPNTGGGQRVTNNQQYILPFVLYKQQNTLQDVKYNNNINLLLQHNKQMINQTVLKNTRAAQARIWYASYFNGSGGIGKAKGPNPCLTSTSVNNNNQGSSNNNQN